MIWLSEHGNHRDELQDGKIRTSINGKSNDGKTTKSTARTIMLNSHYKHQCDGISMKIINNSYKTAKSARVSTARVMMARRRNQYGHQRREKWCMLNSHYKRQRQGQWCDGISMEIIDNSYKTAKSPRASTARVMMGAMKPARTSTARATTRES